MRQKKHIKIYQSRRHLAYTSLIIAAPFIFLLFFSRAAHIASGKLFGDIFTSVFRLFAAYIFAVVIGWVLAVSFYHGKRAVFALPIFDVLQSFPTFAALPTAVFFFGPSNGTVIFFLILTIIWPIFFSTISSLKLIKRDWEEVLTMARLSWADYFRKFILPVSVPGLVTGSVIGLGEGWEAIIATEIIVKIKPGMGSFFELFFRNVPITAFGILGFLILIFVINKLVLLPLLEWSHRIMEE